MSLSDKLCPSGKYNLVECYLPEDVKRSIRELKEKLKDWACYNQYKMPIDWGDALKEIFGEDLLNEEAQG